MKPRHIYHCKICGAAVEIYLNHCGASWTPERGCSNDCEGTFRHPRIRCRFAGRDLHHDDVILKICESP